MSGLETVLGLSKRLPQSKQKIREPTTDIGGCVLYCVVLNGVRDEDSSDAIHGR